LKQKILTTALLLIFTASCLYAQQFDVVIKGKIAQYHSADKILLTYLEEDHWVVDTGKITKGYFSFQRRLKEPCYAAIVMRNLEHPDPSHDETLTFFLEPGLIKIKSSGSLTRGIVSGGNLNKDFEDLNRATSAINAKYELLWSELESDDEKVKASAMRERATLDSLYKIAWRSFIPRHKDSFVSFDVLRSYMHLYDPKNADDIALLFEMLSPSLRATERGKSFAAKINGQHQREIGSIAPDFSRPDSSGHRVSLHEYHGKYLLIDFWASWCVPCRGENPFLITAYEKYRSKGLEIIGVSIDKDREQWIDAIRQDKLHWQQLLDSNENGASVSALYYIDSIPHNYLLGPDGKIIAKDLRGEELEKKLSALLN